MRLIEKKESGEKDLLIIMRIIFLVKFLFLPDEKEASREVI